MAERHVADGESKFTVVCTAPDVCKVGKSVIPFNSFQTLSNEETYIPNVKARGERILAVGSVIKGTQGNLGSGVVSGTSLYCGDCHVLTGSSTVKSHGMPVARHLDDVAMNNGNTIGKLYTEQSAPNGVIENNQHPCSDPPKTSPLLEMLEKEKENFKNLPFHPDKPDEIMRFDDWSKGAQGYIDKIQSSEDSWGVTKVAAGVTRATAGFLKDAFLGIGELAYEGSKFVNPLGLSMKGKDARLNAYILAENIRLGNVCAAQIGQKFDAIKEAVGDAVDKLKEDWNEGGLDKRTEIVTRGVWEVGTIVVPVGKAAWAKKAKDVTKAVDVATDAAKLSNASKVEKAAEVAKAAEAAKAADTAADASKAKKGVDGVKVTKGSPYSHLEDPPNTGAGKDFTQSQKEKIIGENMKKNDGVVKSDQSGETLIKPEKSQKGVTPSNSEWQIDHITPKDKGGTNSYGNAQVLSRGENRAKSNK